VRNIPSTFEEKDLTDLFAHYGDVVQVRILRDQNTMFSRRIGFVIMSTKQMAQNAINNLDNQVPANAVEPIHVKYADEEGRKRQQLPSHNVQQHFANNYDYNTMGSMFNDFQFDDTHLFHGKMKSLRTNNQNRYNPMVSASFKYFANSNQFDPSAAIATGNMFHSTGTSNHAHNNQNLFQNQVSQSYQQIGNVRHGMRHQQHYQANDTSKTGHIVYVYGIGPNTNESDLYSLFQNIGHIQRVNVIKNQKSGVGKGYGFVVFTTYDEAVLAVQNFNGFIFNNRPLQVSLKQS
jgi:RNA recognition motif-containing protein